MQRPRLFRWRARTVSRVLTAGRGFLLRGTTNTEWKIFGWRCIFGEVQLFCWKRTKCGDSNTDGLSDGIRSGYSRPITRPAQILPAPARACTHKVRSHVRFRGQTGHCADIAECPVMTRSRHKPDRNSALQAEGLASDGRRAPLLATPHAYCGVVSDGCCDVSSPRKTLFESSAASPPKPAIACTS